MKLFCASTFASFGAAVCFLVVGKAGLAASFGAMTLFGILITLVLRRQSEDASAAAVTSGAGYGGPEERKGLGQAQRINRVQLASAVLLVLWFISLGTLGWGLNSAFKSPEPSTPVTTMPAAEASQLEGSVCVNVMEGALYETKKGADIGQDVSAFEISLDQLGAKGIAVATAWYRAQLVSYLGQVRTDGVLVAQADTSDAVVSGCSVLVERGFDPGL
jgi:hypothetical protein